MQIISPEWKIQAGKTLSSSGLRPARYHRPVSTKENAVAIEMGHAIIATLASSPFKRQLSEDLSSHTSRMGSIR